MIDLLFYFSGLTITVWHRFYADGSLYRVKSKIALKRNKFLLISQGSLFLELNSKRKLGDQPSNLTTILKSRDL